MLTRALAVIMLAAALTGCGDSGSAPAASNPAVSTKVGLIVTGNTTDGGWNQLASDSLNKMSAGQNLDVKIRQQVSKDTAPDAIRQFDAGGYNVVIAHGYEYQEAAKELTDPSKPDAVKVKIVVSGGDADNPNFQSLAYDLVGASYQLGIVAAKVSKSGKLGFIGGEAVPPVEAMKRGFEAGARASTLLRPSQRSTPAGMIQARQRSKPKRSSSRAWMSLCRMWMRPVAVCLKQSRSTIKNWPMAP